MSKEERPVTEPRWALVRVPWKDESHSLDPITAQIMFDYAGVKGLDLRRCQIGAIPREIWGTVPNEFMIIYQLGTNEQSPTEPPAEDVVRKYKDKDFFDTPSPGQPSYELYRYIYESHRGTLQEIASLLLQIQQKLLKMGVG